MSVTAPPRPPRSSEPVDRDELEALIEALIEEARQRARRRRRRNGAYVLLALVLGIGAYAGIVRAVPQGGSAATASTHPTPAGTGAKEAKRTDHALCRRGERQLEGATGIETVGQAESKVLWQCPGTVFCGQPVSFAWAPDGKRVVFSLDEIGGQSTYVGLHVVNVVSGHDAQIPPGAPMTMSGGAWVPYMEKMNDRVGCWPATDLAWSPDGSSLAYRCKDKEPVSRAGGVTPHQRAETDGIWIHDGSHRNTCLLAFMGSGWRPAGVRDGSHASDEEDKDLHNRARWVTQTSGRHRRDRTRVVTGWEKDRLPDAVWHSPRHSGGQGRNAGGEQLWCDWVFSPQCGRPTGRSSRSRPRFGVYVVDANGRDLQHVSSQSIVSSDESRTWYGALPGRPSWRPVL